MRPPESVKKNGGKRKRRTLLLTEIILLLIFVGLVGFIIYMFYWTTTMYMKVFEIIFGNGWYYIYLIIAGLVFSIINIPLFDTDEGDTIYVNVGGCVVPTIITAYFFYKFNSSFNLMSLFGAMIGTIIVSRIVSVYVKGKGVLIVAIVVELLSVFISIKLNDVLLVRLTFGYIIATIGVIIGGDLMHIGFIGSDGSWGDKLSIGGAGVRDGVWTIGLSTMFFILLAHMFLGW